MTTDDASEPSDWQDVSTYLAQMDDAWRWGYCDPALRRRIHHLVAERAAGRGSCGEVDELLMAWQLLHGFPLEYRLPIGV
jgi:hypothetical protein